MFLRHTEEMRRVGPGALMVVGAVLGGVTAWYLTLFVLIRLQSGIPFSSCPTFRPQLCNHGWQWVLPSAGIVGAVAGAIGAF
jgi:hypothetical protein